MGTLFVGFILIILALTSVWFLASKYFKNIGSFFIDLAKPFKENNKEEENVK